MKSFKVFLKQLSESYIIEAISDLKIQYKNIPEDIFNKAIEQDPTYIPGSPKPGQYTLWILNLINNYYKNIKNNQNYKALLKQYPDGIIKGRQIDEPPVLNQIKPEDIYKIKIELLKFNKYKKHLNKNINQFKDLPELTKANNSIENTGLSTNQKVLKGIDLFKKAEKLGLEIVFNNKNWLVGIPKTKESSVVFANDTKWCTTQNSAKYYEQYTNDGPLYINLNKKTGDLYQFHFESDSFMDSEDESIDEDKLFNENPDLNKFYFNTEDINNINIEQELKNITKITKDTINARLKKRIKNIVIPNNITSIGKKAFLNCKNLNSIVIPNSVKNIEDNAFENCKNLKSITIPDSVISIGKYAFFRCKNLLSAEIPNSVKNIEDSAFEDCMNLKSITIPDNITTIKNYTFAWCDNLKQVILPSTGITSIGVFAFYGCINLNSIIIPDSVKSIGQYAFCHCKNLNSVTISDNLTEIGDNVFKDCNIKEIYIKGNPDKLSQRIKEKLKYGSVENVKIYIINK